MGGLPITVRSPSGAFVAVTVVSHGPDPDRSSINKVTNFCRRDFGKTRFQDSNKTAYN
jgi:hypothetical protein